MSPLECLSSVRMITTAVINNVSCSAYIGVLPRVMPSGDSSFTMSFGFMENDPVSTAAMLTFLSATLPSFKAPKPDITITYPELQALGYGPALTAQSLESRHLCGAHQWGAMPATMWILTVVE